MLESSDNPKGPNKDLTYFADQFCLTNVINEATRTTNYSKTLLDIVLTSHPERLATSGILQVGISDHDLIFVVRKQKLPKPKARTMEFRSLKNLDQKAFFSDLKDVPWDSSYIYDNIDDIWSHWSALYKQVLDDHAPVKKIRLRNNQLPWISPDIQKQIRIRNRLYKKFRRAPTDLNWSNYRVLRNKVTALKRNAIKHFCVDAALPKTSATGQFWKKMKPLLPSNKSSVDSAEIHLLEDGKIISDPSVLFNDYFSQPRICNSALQLSEEDFGDHHSITTIKNKSYQLDFTFMETNVETVTDFLLKLNTKKATGPDGFSPKLLKLSAPAIATPLTSLFNFCINNCTLPKNWKMSDITPIYKKGEVINKNNYRPISVLSVISKLFEKVMFNQLYASFAPTFSLNMSGFLKGHSCATALIKLTDDWRMELDEKKEVGVVAVDLSKAFDCICHNLLLAKLKAYGLQEPALQLMRCYLQDREQRVKCNGVYSDWSSFRCGVPQGSILSPLLFNIFMNDMNESVITSSLRLYADDTTQYTSALSPVILQYSLNQDSDKLSNWLHKNFLQPNGDKTQAMILGKSNYKYHLEFDGTPIDIKDQLKILGITLDNKLSFKEHTNDMLKKIYAKIGALRRLKRLVPANILLILYKSFVLSHFEYCNSLLIGIGRTINKKLENANYYGLRTVMNMGKSISYESMLRIADMRTLEQRRIEQSLIIFFKCFKENGPAYINNFFKPRITSYNLRNSGHNVVQNPHNTKYLHNSYTYIISRIWNQLPLSAKTASNVSVFRRHLNKLNFIGCQCNSCL